jgi:hypothetical protein
MHSLWYGSVPQDCDSSEHKHNNSWLSTYCNSISITTNCKYINMSEPNIKTYVNNSVIFFKSGYYV